MQNSDHDPVSATLRLIASDGIQSAWSLLDTLDRAQLSGDSEATTDALAAIAHAIRVCTPTHESNQAVVESFNHATDVSQSLPACGACGMRSTMSTSSEFQNKPLATLAHLRFTSEQEAEFQQQHELKRKVRSTYLSTSGHRYHVHPELVTQREEETVMLCGLCRRALAGGKIPSLSIADGCDYGVLSRLASHVPLRAIEERAVSLVRSLTVIKYKSASNEQPVILGHSIAFPHNGPSAAIESLTASNLATRVRSQVSLTFLCPSRLRNVMRDAGYRSTDLEVRPEAVISFLNIMKNTHELYQDIDVSELSSEAVAIELQSLRRQLVDDARFVNSEVAMEMDSIATNDVARVREHQDNHQQQEDAAPELPNLEGVDSSLLGGFTLNSADDINSAALQAILRAITPAETIRLRVSQTEDGALNEYLRLSSIVTATFPEIFPLGFLHKREGPLTARELKHLLLQFTNLPAKNHRLQFQLFNMLQRQAVSRGVTPRIRNEPGLDDEAMRLLRSESVRSSLERVARPIPESASRAQAESLAREQRQLLSKLLRVVTLAGGEVSF